MTARNTAKTVVDKRNYERLLVGVHRGTIALDVRDYRYRAVNGTDMDDTMFQAEDRGWVHLTPGRPPKVTAVGYQWLADRYHRFGVAPTRPAELLPILPPQTGTQVRQPRGQAHTPRPGNARRGQSNPRARLTEEQVRGIRERLAAGGTRQVTVAAELGVSRSLINKIVRGNNWRHVA